jgi:hypothetical protein
VLNRVDRIMTDQFVLDFYAAALVITLATYPTVKMIRVVARDARLAAKAAARKRAEDNLAAAYKSNTRRA